MSAEEEKEANAFAMELLMPEPFIRREIERLRITDLSDDKQIKALAIVFAVPVSLMSIRLGRLLDV